MIQNDQMKREEAIKFARKYDDEFPKSDFKEVLDFLDIDENKFEEIVNRHRNQEIWQTERNNQWGLINKV